MGAGHTYSILEMVKIFENLSGKKVNIVLTVKQNASPIVYST